ncbi:hypothetical protein J3459_014179 [Metarhizium acridum]|nr:hypothetical protein J3459_014179 [Metarhizium acridum]
MIKPRIITVLPSSSSQQSEEAKSDGQSTKKLTFDRCNSRDAAHALRITTSDDFGTMPVLTPSEMLCTKSAMRTLGLYLRPERYIGSSKARQKQEKHARHLDQVMKVEEARLSREVWAAQQVAQSQGSDPST